MNPNENADLVFRVLQGDADAFEELYRATKDRVYFICLSLLKNEHDAADAVQDVYLAAYKNLYQLSDPTKFEAWTDRIAVNRCKDILKKKTPVPVDDSYLNETLWDEEELSLPETYIVNKQQREVLMNILRSELSELQFEAVILYYFNRFSITEIAEMTESSEGAVKNRLSTARSKIKKAVEMYEHDNNDTLFAAVGMPFLSRLLDEECRHTVSPDLWVQILSKTSLTFSGAATTASAAAHTVTAVGKAGAGITGKKVIFGIVAGVLAVAIGGTVTVSTLVKNGTIKMPELIPGLSVTNTDNGETAEPGSYVGEKTKFTDLGEITTDGNVKSFDCRFVDPYIHIVTDDNIVYRQLGGEMVEFCTLDDNFEGLEPKIALDNSSSEKILVRMTDGYRYYFSEYGYSPQIIDFKAENLIAVAFRNDILHIYTLDSGKLFVTLINTKGETLDEKKTVVIEDNIGITFSAENIREAYTQNSLIAVLMNDGTLYYAEPQLYESASDEYKITVQNGYEPILNVSSVVGNLYDAALRPPFYTVDGDSDNLYFNRFASEYSENSDPYVIPLPDGCHAEDIEEAVMSERTYLILKDGSVYSNKSIINGTDWEYDETLSNMKKAGQLKSISPYLTGLYLFCNDGCLYLYEE